MKKLFFIPLVMVGMSAMAQSSRAIAYVEKHKAIAQKESEETGIPASIILSQAGIESAYGMSRIAKKQNNHFGMKKRRSSRYRTYQTVSQSYVDYANVIKHNKHFARLIQLHITDYKIWAHTLVTAKYAHNVHYAQDVILNIQKLHLTRFDI